MYPLATSSASPLAKEASRPPDSALISATPSEADSAASVAAAAATASAVAAVAGAALHSGR
jgi:hypothetical protein